MTFSSEFKINFDFIYNDEEVKKNVYLPSSDTFTFVDALENEVDNISSDVNIVLEMGTGSGYLTLFLYELLKRKNKNVEMFYCVDINKSACNCVKKVLRKNNILNAEIINNDLFNNIRKCELFDIILFNPPYVPTEQNEMDTTNIVASYAGGKYGREIILKFLLNVYDYLNKCGVIYILLEKNNRPNEIMNHTHITEKFLCSLIKKKKTLNETIFIYKLKKKVL
ncbi:methyltransferase, putative [Hepatocystis sp. ex Piliocolobus tephrosceles]|nr:methyltransferase, putative [Hepatocystis sp. ex Piliocolobus tephrosceles]